MMEQAPDGYRSRNQDGRLLDKRDDTHMDTIERQYGRDTGVRSDMVGQLPQAGGHCSLNDLVHRNHGKK